MPWTVACASNVINPGVTSVMFSLLYLVQGYSGIGLKAGELVGE